MAILTTESLDNLVDDIGRPLTDEIFGAGPASEAILSSRVLDLGLEVLNLEANRIYLCSAEPTTYGEATAVYALGFNDFGVGGVFSNVTNAAPGRKVSSAPVFSGTVLANGEVTHWAVVDSVNTRLLARGPVAVPGSVSVGVGFSLLGFDITMLGQ